MAMHLCLRLLPLAAASLLSVAASAQVVRCTDARTGAVTYTDGDCNPGTRVREVQARQTPEEIAQERAQAAQALEEKQQRLQSEAATQQLENERQSQRQRDQAARAAVVTAANPSQAYARSPECARSRRNFEFAASSAGSLRYDQDAQMQAAQRQMELDCLGPEGYANLEKNRPPPAPAPIVVYPPQRWDQHQHRQRPWPQRPPPPAPQPPPPPRPFGVQPQPSVSPAASIAPRPSVQPQSALQSPASNRRCVGRDCD